MNQQVQSTVNIYRNQTTIFQGAEHRPIVPDLLTK
jgi:hypothetical protein